MVVELYEEEIHGQILVMRYDSVLYVLQEDTQNVIPANLFAVDSYLHLMFRRQYIHETCSYQSPTVDWAL